MASNTLREVSPTDSAHLAKMLRSGAYLHRHLDWMPVLDWIGRRPFWLYDTPTGPLAALACLEDPPGVAWVRLFLCALEADPEKWFSALFDRCLQSFPQDTLPIIPSLALSEWYAAILERNYFQLHQYIVALHLDLSQPFPHVEFNPDLFIRFMEPEDIPAVTKIDWNAFEPIWQNSIEQVSLSYNQAYYASVAEINGLIIGFQITTGSVFSAHLARLAVDPPFQGHGIGLALLQDLAHFCRRQSLHEISLNTQSDNHASLSLYKRVGFKLGQERFPVYLFQP